MVYESIEELHQVYGEGQTEGVLAVLPIQCDHCPRAEHFGQCDTYLKCTHIIVFVGRSTAVFSGWSTKTA